MTFTAFPQLLVHLPDVNFVCRIEKEKNALQSEGDDLSVSLETLQKQKVRFFFLTGVFLRLVKVRRSTITCDLCCNFSGIEIAAKIASVNAVR